MLKLIKKSWNDISISDFYILEGILTDTELNETDKTLELVKVFTGLDDKELLNSDLGDYNSVVAEINSIFTTNIPESANNKLDNVVLDGIKYKIVKDLDKISVGQYLDFQTYMHQDKNMANILSVFLIPEGKTYGEGYSISEFINTLNNKLNIITAKQLCNFFVKWSEKLTKRSLTYWKWKMNMMMWKMGMSKKMKKEMNSLVNNTIQTIGYIS